VSHATNSATASDRDKKKTKKIVTNNIFSHLEPAHVGHLSQTLHGTTGRRNH